MALTPVTIAEWPQGAGLLNKGIRVLPVKLLSWGLYIGRLSIKLSTPSPLRQIRNAMVVPGNWENTKNNVFPQTMLFKSPWMRVDGCTGSFHYFCFEREREFEGGSLFCPFFGVCFIKIFVEKYHWLEYFFWKPPR